MKSFRGCRRTDPLGVNTKTVGAGGGTSRDQEGVVGETGENQGRVVPNTPNGREKRFRYQGETSCV